MRGEGAGGWRTGVAHVYAAHCTNTKEGMVVSDISRHQAPAGRISSMCQVLVDNHLSEDEASMVSEFAKSVALIQLEIILRVYVCAFCACLFICAVVRLL